MGLNHCLARQWIRLLSKCAPSPVKKRHSEISLVFAQEEDDVSQPSQYLISVALDAIRNALNVSLEDISTRIRTPPRFPNIWPGEHYKLLAGLVLALKPSVVVEVGTYTGLSALAMSKYLPHGSKLVTFDVVDWKAIPDSCLREDDFRDGGFVQYVADLSDPRVALEYGDQLAEAGLIFFDAAKDGIMEQKFLENLRLIRFRTNPLLVFDDIRVWNMLGIWQDIRLPKLDLTSFGHWSGTGIVEWKL
ncbi:MAG: methyltransferase [Armatimonadetes bacterium]|nr:methyltransferase [Armatimonadota bacterium]